MGQPRRIFIVDDHVILGEVIGRSLSERGFVTELCSSGTAAEVVAAAHTFHPDVVLLDLGLWKEAGDSVALVEPLSRFGSRTIVLTGSDDRVLHAGALSAGAVGVVAKQHPFRDVLEAVHATIEGRALATPAEVDRLMCDLRSARTAAQDRLATFSTLTRREAIVLGLLMDGVSAALIAERECVSVATVRSQIHSVLVKLDVHSQLAAVAKAREAGWRPGSHVSMAG